MVYLVRQMHKLIIEIKKQDSLIQWHSAFYNIFCDNMFISS